MTLEYSRTITNRLDDDIELKFETEINFVTIDIKVDDQRITLTLGELRWIEAIGRQFEDAVKAFDTLVTP